MGPRNKPADLERTALMKSIFSEIQSLYDAGVPFFTKENIRRVGEELDHFRRGERENGAKITMPGVNGLDYEVLVQPLVSMPPSPNQIFDGEKWTIHYKTVRLLATFWHPDIRTYDPQSAYGPMKISAVIRILDNYDPSLYEKPPVPPAEDFSIYQALEQEWKMTQHYAQLEEILTNIEIPFTLTKVIAVALGPFTIKSQITRHSFIQHAFVSTIHSILVRRGTLPASAEKYVQDPAYSSRCKDLIQSVGFTIIDDPRAWLDMDESSVLVSINADITVEDIVADLCRPGIIIWTDETECPDPRFNSRAAKMIENEYSRIRLPHNEDFGPVDMALLIRKPT
ncbi:hypothetical protein O1611_g3804 [Lasiodiplodia mahajangana]|uniref:Uncharacterized protein n=1 Tax=Lasiodiplodia mahajangana TaxID=1108764 RepID=A0ACC2JQY3_9PEZI|nr:hypothetical protein O1611_g3804 [Lasiodiplodia mahajangana]